MPSSNIATSKMIITIGSTKLDTLNVSVVDANVSLQLDEASSASFTIVDAYDIEKSAYQSNLKSVLRLGNEVSIEVEYNYTKAKIFTGFIANITKRYQRTHSITVTALDKRRLMMDNHREEVYQKLKPSDIVSKIMGTYGMSAEVDTSNVTFDHITQNCSDFTFIKKVLCPLANAEFFFQEGKAYFKNTATLAGRTSKLKWEEQLYSFSSSSTYDQLVVEIHGFNEKTKEAITGKKEVKSAKDLIKLTSYNKKIIPNASLEAQTEADNRAGYEVYERLKKNRTGKGSCIGSPELFPGNFIEISNLPGAEETYCLNQVNYIMNSRRGFVTEFEIGGWK